MTLAKVFPKSVEQLNWGEGALPCVGRGTSSSANAESRSTGVWSLVSGTAEMVGLVHNEAEEASRCLSFGSGTEKDFFFFLSTFSVEDLEPDLELGMDFCLAADLPLGFAVLEKLELRLLVEKQGQGA